MQVLGDQVNHYMNTKGLNEAAVEHTQEELDKKLNKKNSKGKKVARKQGDTLISRFLSNASHENKMGMLNDNIMAHTAASLQKDTQMIEETLKRELGDLFKESSDTKDSVEISKKAAEKIASQLLPDEQDTVKTFKRKGDGGGNFFGEGEGDVEGGEKKAKLRQNPLKKTVAEHVLSKGHVKNLDANESLKKVKQFSSTLISYVANQSPAQKEKLKTIKNELRQGGMSVKQVLHMEQNVGAMVRQQYIYTLKKDLLNYLFSKSDPKQKVNTLLMKKTYDAQAKKVTDLNAAGLIPGSIQSMTEEIGFETRKELEHFLYDEAGKEFVKVGLGESSLEDYTKLLIKLQKVAGLAGVVINEEELSQKVVKTVEDLGLQSFIPPVGGNSFSFQEGSGQGNQGQKEEIVMNQEEMFEDKLRYLYMERRLNPSLKDSIELVFKMKKVKNGLIKLGISVNERLSQLQREGDFLAQMKLMSLLEDNFKEQASLHKLEGPAYKLIKKNRAFLVRQLKKLGCRLNRQRLNDIRDKMTLQLYPVVLEQLKQTEVAFSYKKTAGIGRQAKLLRSILDRLEEETEIPYEKEQNSKILNLNNKTVIEDA